MKNGMQYGKDWKKSIIFGVFQFTPQTQNKFYRSGYILKLQKQMKVFTVYMCSSYLDKHIYEIECRKS